MHHDKLPHEEHRWHSKHLGQEMTLRTYGHAGKPMLVFPCQEGRYFEYEDFGMTEILRPWIEAGKLRLFTVDSVDSQSWCNQGIHPRDRAIRHSAYEQYLTDEVIPFIRGYSGEPLAVTGCSMGGYHAANFFFRHPDLADTLMAISGLYKLTYFIGDYMDDEIYFHVPLAYLPKLEDPWFLDRYRNAKIFICVGQGAWEDEMLDETRQLSKVLEEKNIPAVIDIWGEDVNHDWVWWRKMVPYIMEQWLPLAQTV